MTDTVGMHMFSRLRLTPEVASDQLRLLANFEGGVLRPEKWDLVEPIKKVFDPADLTEPVRELSAPFGSFFYRAGRPLAIEGAIWNRQRPQSAKFPGPVFSNAWQSRFSGKWVAHHGTQIVERFATEAFLRMKADFGFITTEVDLLAKNTDARHLSYQCMTLTEGLPGLYWLNFFSEELASWLRLSNFPSELAASSPLTGNGALLRFSESVVCCRDLDVLARQRATIAWLGHNRFFDIHHLGRKLEVYDWQELPSASSSH